VTRFNADGVDSIIHDEGRKPGTPPVSLDLENETSRIVCTEEPGGTSHRRVWSLPEIVGISHAAVHNVLRERELKPHQVQSLQFSTDPDFEQKLDDVVGLYLSPREYSKISSVDKKFQIRALERSQPVLPLRPGVPESQSHDYCQDGATTRFAALNVANGQVLGDCKDDHKSIDYTSFVKKIDRSNSEGKVLHLVVDNYSAHKSAAVKEFLAKRGGRFVIHFIPTHSAWLELVERWFAAITNTTIRRESWTGVSEQQQSILGFIRNRNDSGKRFQWVRTSEQIKERVAHAKKRYEK